MPLTLMCKKLRNTEDLGTDRRYIYNQIFIITYLLTSVVLLLISTLSKLYLISQKSSSPDTRDTC